MSLFHDITVNETTRLPLTGVQEWDRDGVRTLPGIIPSDLIDAYVEERTRLIGNTPKWRPGWNGPCPYLHVSSMRALALHRPLTEVIRTHIGIREPGLHLCLTGFQSTERKWHQDRYLNPESVGERYIAAWIALDDVHENAGPFSYFPGSHRWPVIERGKIWAEMKKRGQDLSLPTWPSDSQDWVGEACEQEAYERGAQLKTFIGKKGDVLLWHASLIHQGSLPKDRTLERRALIAHYSAVDARPDMPHCRRMENGSWYFDFPGYQEPGDTTHQSKK